MWLLAEKLRQKGFPNLFDYYSKEFKDPETGKAPTNAMEFAEIAAKITQRVRCGCRRSRSRATRRSQGWADFRRKGMFSGPKYTLKKGWGGKFATATKKFEFYSETAKKGLEEHAKKYQHDGRRHPGGHRLRGARRAGLRAALRAAEAPRQRGASTRSTSSTTSRASTARAVRRTCPGTRSSRRSIRATSRGTTC